MTEKQNKKQKTNVDSSISEDSSDILYLYLMLSEPVFLLSDRDIILALYSLKQEVKHL